jgi:hypothetical protein
MWLGITQNTSNWQFGKRSGISGHNLWAILPACDRRISPATISPKKHCWLSVQMVTK